MQSLLNIKEYFVDELYVKSNPAYQKKDAATGEINVDFDIKRNKETPLDFLVSMTIEVNKKEEAFLTADYQVSLKISGFFSFAEGTVEETVIRMIGPSGLSILYGVARGVVAQATAQSWHGKFVLPSLNFVELLRQKAKAVEDAAKPKKSKKK